MKQQRVAGTKARIGLVGFGYIGSYVFEQIRAHPEWELEIAFVWNRREEKLEPVPPGLRLERLENFDRHRPDLVVEVAHPSITADYGEAFLRHSDYMPLSLTALSDAALEARLRSTATAHGHCLMIPHGGAAGLDTLSECREMWEEVTVIMKKNPGNLDFTCSPELDPGMNKSETVLYDGPTRGICPLFPRNVNTHAAAALAGIGFDQTRSVLVATPDLGLSEIHILARGNGLLLDIKRQNPLQGVSGVLTLRSIVGSICRARAAGIPLQVS